MAAWDDTVGLVELPSGVVVRGRRLRDAVSPADFALVLGKGPARERVRARARLERGTVPSWPYRRIAWPDFWIPTDRADALDALHEAHRRAHAGERVEVACGGGIGRTGTALAALAIVDGLPADQAVRWVRAVYHHRAVETPWQRRWLRGVNRGAR